MSIKKIQEHFEKTPSEKYKKINTERLKGLNINNKTYNPQENRPIFIIIEGSQIYNDNEIINMLNVKFFLESNTDTSFERRYEKNDFNSKDLFFNFIMKNFLKNKSNQIQNSKAIVIESKSIPETTENILLILKKMDLFEK
jgi:uridine kinase